MGGIGSGNSVDYPVRSPYPVRTRNIASVDQIFRIPCEVCGKLFKFSAGIRMHLASSDCGKVDSPVKVGPCPRNQD